MTTKSLWEGIKNVESYERGRLKGPCIIGRFEEGDTDERAETVKRLEVSVHHHFDSDVSVQLFESVDDEDRGGVVLRLQSTLSGGGWDAHVVQHAKGVDLHFCGDGEAAAFLEALRVIVETFFEANPKWKERICGIHLSKGPFVEPRPDATEKPVSKSRSPIEELLFRALVPLVPTGVELHAQHQVCGCRVDLVLVGPKSRVVIECDGHDYHERTKEQARRDREKDRAFQRAGWIIARFTGSEIYADAEKCACEALGLLSICQ